MPRQVTCYDIYELSYKESQGEIMLETEINTQLHIVAKENETIIQFPYGNKFDIIDGRIIIHPKKQ